MFLTIAICMDQCNKTFYIASPQGLDNDGFTGVYCCPCCKGFNFRMVVKPIEIEAPTIKIKGGTPEEKSRAATAMALLARQGPQPITIAKLRSSGRRNDEPRDGPRQELQEPAIDGVVLSRPDAPKYEKEVSQYLGVPAEGDSSPQYSG